MKPFCRFALLAHPGSRRALGFEVACRKLGFPEPRLIPWEDWLSGRLDSADQLAGIDGLRIETPAENPATERLLLSLGTDASEEEGIYPCLPASACRTLPPDEGELRYQRQWYHGWNKVLGDLSDLCNRLSIRPMNHPAEIAVLFDKEATRRALLEKAVPLPPGAGICSDFDDLIAKMDEHSWDRVFLKPCHGSSASGVMAIARSSRGAWQVVSSALLEDTSEGPRIRNDKRLRRLTDLRQIRATVNAVCRQRALVERWFPKATLQGRSFDLRVLVIAGGAAHVAVRSSSFPITNLHLRNHRGDSAAVIRAIGDDRWQEGMACATRAAACFPASHYCGVDLMLGPGGRSHAIAELNAFGDLLHRELWRGMNPWEAELSTWHTKEEQTRTAV